jgi:hypothetical protein
MPAEESTVVVARSKRPSGAAGGSSAKQCCATVLRWRVPMAVLRGPLSSRISLSAAFPFFLCEFPYRLTYCAAATL